MEDLEKYKGRRRSFDQSINDRTNQREVWSGIEDDLDDIDEEDIRRVEKAKYKYSNVGSGFCKVSDMAEEK